MTSQQFTTTPLNDSATTGGFASLSSPSSHAGGAASASSEQTPIAPSTLSAVEGSHSTSTAPASTKYSEPNIPAAAQDLAGRAPSGDEIQQKSHQYIDQAAQLASQAKTQAGELVAPKDKEQLNETEEHIDSVTRGFAGMLATAPLAGIEKISPVVAQKLDSAAQVLASKYHETVEPAAGQYAQQASDAVRSYLPASLGGKVTGTTATTGATTTDGATLGERANAAAQSVLPESIGSKLPGAASTEAVTTTTDGSTGPTVTEQASSALNSASQSASSTAYSASQSAQSAFASAGQSAKQTADAYLPESVASKIPGTGAAASSSSVDSPYVPLSQDKPTSTLPSTATKGSAADTAIVSDFSSSTGTSKQFSGLEPQTTSQLPAEQSTSVEKPTQGAPMYTQAASGDYKTDQTQFAPAEYAAEKHARRD
ncbi:hypothetical protein BCR35DRAFT_310812 [Leucosporidium creatinivorum]|uniref:Uncharacterized protein n=1 Tax=Leucosporidium creatinivorum TaxID=106004 RepID=A0A1Y2CQI9_9BASI|nr:hypothetical protein BCR35DRAFT_310812 [Leucosporidium creatinivorum]